MYQHPWSDNKSFNHTRWPKRKEGEDMSIWMWLHEWWLSLSKRVGSVHWEDFCKRIVRESFLPKAGGMCWYPQHFPHDGKKLNWHLCSFFLVSWEAMSWASKVRSSPAAHHNVHRSNMKVRSKCLYPWRINAVNLQKATCTVLRLFPSIQAHWSKNHPIKSKLVIQI